MPKRNNSSPQKMEVYKCDECGGTGRVIADWNAFNQLSIPVGFSEEMARRHSEYYKRAYGDCHKCGGKGFVLIPAKNHVVEDNGNGI